MSLLTYSTLPSSLPPSLPMFFSRLTHIQVGPVSFASLSHPPTPAKVYACFKVLLGHPTPMDPMFCLTKPNPRGLALFGISIHFQIEPLKKKKKLKFHGLYFCPKKSLWLLILKTPSILILKPRFGSFYFRDFACYYPNLIEPKIKCQTLLFFKSLSAHYLDK